MHINTYTVWNVSSLKKGAYLKKKDKKVASWDVLSIGIWAPLGLVVFACTQFWLYCWLTTLDVFSFVEKPLLMMNWHYTTNIYHLDAILVHSLMQIWHLAPIKAKFDISSKTSVLASFLNKDKKRGTFTAKLNICVRIINFYKTKNCNHQNYAF